MVRWYFENRLPAHPETGFSAAAIAANEWLWVYLCERGAPPPPEEWPGWPCDAANRGEALPVAPEPVSTPGGHSGAPQTAKERRREYMRELMRQRRARAKEGPATGR